jgi:hypothetical protein
VEVGDRVEAEGEVRERASEGFKACIASGDVVVRLSNWNDGGIVTILNIFELFDSAKNGEARIVPEVALKRWK